MVEISLTKEQLEKINSIIRNDLLELVEKVGGRVKDSRKHVVKRFIVLNKGAHDIEGALKKQFGDVEIIYVSEGNIKLREVEEYAIKVAKIYDPEKDVILLTGPALLSVLATILTYVKSPNMVKIAQFDLQENKYKIVELSHLELRKKLT